MYQSNKDLITNKQLNHLAQLMAIRKISNEDMSKKYGVSDITELTKVQASDAIGSLRSI